MGKKLSEVSYILSLINNPVWKYYYNNTCFFQDGACFKDCIDYYGNDVVATSARDAAGKSSWISIVQINGYLFTTYYYISGCQFNCQQNQECQVWTFNSKSGGKGNNCWLKTSDAFMSYSCNRISGPKYCGKKI